jgi:predicted nucleotidyltransferase/DNA-binding XRE family transcriptional regulator
MTTKSLGTLIRLAREDVGMTQRELAAAAGIQQPTISAYESGAKVPQEETVRRLLRAARTRPSIPLMFFADDIQNAAARVGLSNVRVFGSTIHGRDTENSDIDLIVHAGEHATIFGLADFTNEVTELTGFGVDVLTERQAENPFFAHILDEAVPL